MIRAEYLCINRQAYFLDPEFNDYVVKYCIDTANAFAGEEVWYRSADLVCHHINALKGADVLFEERNYIMGLRGVRRNIRFRATFEKELANIIQARESVDNLHLLLPFISTLDELDIVFDILAKLKYDGKVGVMAEIPSIIFQLPEALKYYNISRVVVGLNDLSSFVLGAARELEAHNMTHPTVVGMVKMARGSCAEANTSLMLAGYLNRDVAAVYEREGFEYMIVHYHLLPDFFEVENGEVYTRHYTTINDNFSSKRRSIK